MKIKTACEIGVTLVILFLIYSFVTNDDVMKHMEDKVIDSQVQSLTGMSSAAVAGERSENGNTVYDAAAGETDVKKLEAMAKGEAGKMMRSGNTSEYQKEMENNPLLDKITGQQ